MTVKIRLIKNLQNSIKNLTRFFKELNWAYKQEHQSDNSTNLAKKPGYISKTYFILFCSNLKANAEW